MKNRFIEFPGSENEEGGEPTENESYQAEQNREQSGSHVASPITERLPGAKSYDCKLLSLSLQS